MTDLMPKVLPQYAFREKTRHGRNVFYFRKGKGQRIRLPDFGKPDFEERYHAALMNLEPPKRRTAASGSLEWLIEQYRKNAAYLRLSAATQRQRDNIFENVVAISGPLAPFKDVTPSKIKAGRDARAETPAQSRNFLDAMRGLFRWADDAGHVAEDPTLGVKNIPRRKSEGFAPWTDADVAAYEGRWPAGSKERVWLHVLLYTGLRRGDAVLLGRQHVKDAVATIKTEKTKTEVSIPVMPELAHTLAAGPTGDLAFIVGETGQPLAKESFGNMFRTACNAAGVRKSAHGVRKLAATIAAEAGATVNELEAWFGWEGGQMASLYTRKADRKRLARQAGDKMENAHRPHLAGQRPAPIKA